MSVLVGPVDKKIKNIANIKAVLNIVGSSAVKEIKVNGIASVALRAKIHA